MVKIELSDELKLIKYQMKIFKFKMTMMYLIKLLEVKFKMTSNQNSKLRNPCKMNALVHFKVYHLLYAYSS